jgi:LysM repeat protein
MKQLKLVPILAALAIVLGAAITLIPSQTSHAQGDCGESVTVQQGNTLFGIALRCDTTVPALLAVNPEITDPARLEVGQVIFLPAPANDVDPLVAISPQRGEPGTTVNVIANGLPINRNVVINIGPEGETPILTRNGRTDDAGGVSIALTIPNTFDTTNPRWLVTVLAPNRGVMARSFPFLLTADVPDDGDTLFTETQVFLVDLENLPVDQICTEPVVPYTIDIQPTLAPLTVAIDSLLNTRQYGGPGLYNAFRLSELILTGIDINNRQATIALSGDLQLLGECDDEWMTAQLRQTALQYDTIDRVEILLNGQPFAEALAEAQ